MVPRGQGPCSGFLPSSAKMIKAKPTSWKTASRQVPQTLPSGDNSVKLHFIVVPSSALTDQHAVSQIVNKAGYRLLVKVSLAGSQYC